MRALRILLIVTVVLGALFVAADRIAVSFAESEAADRAQQTQGLSSKPDVSIKGFPFLTQVVSRKLDDVQVTGNGIEVGGGGRTLRIERFSADLHGVRLPDGSSGAAVADSAEGSAFITYADLSKAAPDGFTIAYGGKDKDGKGQVKVTARVAVPLLGVQKVSLVSQVEIEGGDTVKVRVLKMPKILGMELPSGVEKEVRGVTDRTWKITGLLGGIKLGEAEATADGITATGSGTDVVLAN